MSGYLPTGNVDMGFLWTREGDPAPYETSHAFAVDATTLLEVNTLAVGICDAWKDLFLPYLPAVAAVGMANVRYNLGAGAVSMEVGSFTNGTGGTQLTSQNSAIVWRKFTGEPGRANRGRMYLPIVTPANVSQAGQVDTEWAADLVTAWADFGATVLALDHVIEFVLLHEPTPGDPTPSPTPVVAHAPAPLVGSQRRRVQ